MSSRSSKYNELLKSSSDIEEDKAYALMGELVRFADSAGSFTDSEGNVVRIADHIYVVGGAVRNFVIGQPVKDIDIVIDAMSISTRRIARDAKWLAELIIKKAPPNAEITQTSNQYGVEILHVHGTWLVGQTDLRGQDIEIAFARSESYADGGWKPEEVSAATIEEDAKRREFTFNTLLWSFSDLADHGPSEEIIQDPLGNGLDDLRNNIIDTPLSPEKTFEDDASRMMRAMKFQFKYGFEISERVQSAIKNNPEFLRNVPTEILYGLLTTTILNQPTYKQALEEMKQNNILPELVSILKSDNSFRTSMRNWVEKTRDLTYLFNLLDYGLPFGDSVNFLNESEQQMLRSNVLSMQSDRQADYLTSLRNIGNAIKDKKFFMRAFDIVSEDIGFSKRDIPLFRTQFYSKVAKEILLEDPSLMDRPEEIKEKMTSKLLELSNGNMDKESFTNNYPIIKRASVSNPFDFEIPGSGGTVYLFDMDDTLFWTPEWHSIVSTSDAGEAVSVNMDYPNVFHKALKLVSEINDDYKLLLRKDKKGRIADDLVESFPSEIGKLRLVKEVVDIAHLGKKDQIIFVLSDEKGPVAIPVLKKYFSNRTLSSIDMRGRYAEGKALIAGDNQFYEAPETLGTVANDEILSIYKSVPNPMVLTARKSAPRMQEGIRARLAKAGAQDPAAVFTNPGHMSSGNYKGHVIGQIAQQPAVLSVVFYDDNLKYINAVKKVLEEEYTPEDAAKVTVHLVGTELKPDGGGLVAMASYEAYLKNLIAVANSLDKKGLLCEADQVDEIINKLQSSRR